MEKSMCDRCDLEMTPEESVQTIDNQILCEGCSTKWTIEQRELTNK